MPYITGLKSSGASNSVATNAEVSGLSGGGAALPVGAVVPFVGASLPTNMLLCDGSAVSRTTYSSLFAIIGTSFGVGDGSTTFNLPNFRTNASIPIGKDSSVTDINTLGKSGGAFNHTHTSTAHVHSFTHSHDMGNHTHTYDHTHTMGNHTHTAAHYHGLGNHVHLWGAHGHGLAGLAWSLGAGTSHTHTYATQTTSTAGGTSGPRQSNSSTANATNTSSTSTVGLGTSIAVGSSGTDMSVSGMWSGYPRWNDGVTDRNLTTTVTPTTDSISTNTTGSATGSTGAPSTNTTGSYSGNTDSGGGSLTTTASNPPYLTVNFIIQVQ